MLTLLKSRRGLAAIEFALLLPVLTAVLFGVVDLSLGVVMSRRLTVAAQETATIASTMAVQAGSLNVITGAQAWQASTAPFALFPLWRASPSSGSFAITLSAVNFTTAASCKTGCTYAAAVAWSAANPAGQPELRACGSLAAVPNTSPSSLANLPAGLFGATSVLVADVSSVYVPMFTGVFVGDVPMLRSAYVSPRIYNGVSLSGAFPGPFVRCPAPAA